MLPKNINTIPSIKLGTPRLRIIEPLGYDFPSQKETETKRQTEAMMALTFLSTNQFCFYWVRMKTERKAGKG